MGSDLYRVRAVDEGPASGPTDSYLARPDSWVDFAGKLQEMGATVRAPDKIQFQEFLPDAITFLRRRSYAASTSPGA